MDYKVDKASLIEVKLRIAFDSTTGACDVYNTDQYDSLVELESKRKRKAAGRAQAATEPAPEDVSVGQEGASDTDVAVDTPAVSGADENASPVVPDDLDDDASQQPLARYPLDQYHEEWAQFIPTDFGLDTRIAGEASLYNPFSGHYYDNSALRAAKIKYLLRSWSLDIPLRITTLNGVEQLHAKTLAEIDQIPSTILMGFLMEYDSRVYGT